MALRNSNNPFSKFGIWDRTEEKQISLLDTSLFSSGQQERRVGIQCKPVTLGQNTTFHLCSTMESTPTVCFP